MELHNLKPASGSVKNNTRKGRGQGSGKGGTSTRGHKGAKARSGYSSKRAFEGGQMPLQMRLPKRGFKNPGRVSYVALNLGRIQEIATKYNVDQINIETLSKLGIISKNDLIKILGNGDLKSKVQCSVHAVSETAKTKIEALGGSVNII